MISSLSVLPILPLSHHIPHEPPDIPLDILFPFPSFRLLFHIRDCRQWIDSQQHPPRSKQLIAGCCAAHYPHFSNISVGCQVRLLHMFLQTRTETVLLCWHGKSVAGFTDSLKPHALRVPSCRRAGLDRIRSASLRGTCASQAKKAKGEFPDLLCLGQRGTKEKEE